MSPEHKLSQIRQIAITVADVDQAVTFYGQVLGLGLLFRAGPNLAFLAAGDIRIMLTTPQGAGTPGNNSLLYFKVNGISETYSAIIARGAPGVHEPQLTARMPDHELWTAFVRDPEGNLIGLMEEKRS